MLVTDIGTIEGQAPLNPGFRKAIEFLHRKNLADLPDGTVPLDGKRVYAIIQSYTTAHADPPKFEYHRKYIDVQYVLSGEEVIGWAPAARMAVSVPYDSDQDICFGSMSPGTWTPVRLGAGQLAVLWPEDGHAPRLAAGAPQPVRKIVIKIAV